MKKGGDVVIRKVDKSAKGDRRVFIITKKDRRARGDKVQVKIVKRVCNYEWRRILMSMKGIFIVIFLRKKKLRYGDGDG